MTDKPIVFRHFPIPWRERAWNAVVSHVGELLLWCAWWAVILGFAYWRLT